jgi:phage FluMu protein Com
MEVFCPRCHRLAAIVARNGDETKIVQNGKAMLNIKGNTKMNNFSVKCPHGHPVQIKLGGI